MSWSSLELIQAVHRQKGLLVGENAHQAFRLLSLDKRAEEAGG